jgi:DNA-binding transcriptional MocR family regulator
VVEDGVHALMHEDAPAPLAAHLPDHGYFLTSHSKTMSPSVRVGCLRAPPDAHDALARALRATLWMVSPLLAEVVSACIEDGTADRLLHAKRVEARARQEVAREVLERFEMDAGATSHHTWLRLPEGWRAEDFVREARNEGVAVTAPSAFLAGQVTTPRAVRISLGAASTRDRLREGTEVIRDLLERGPDPGRSR